MDGPFYMDAVIEPHRSLSRRGFIVLISVLTSLNAATAVAVFLIGGAPAPVFLGVDLVAVIVAFLVSNAAARRNERIQVTAAEVRVLSQRGAALPQTIWISPTAFTRVALHGDAGDPDDLALRLSDRQLSVARALSRPERLAFAQALDGAIARARSGRF